MKRGHVYPSTIKIQMRVYFFGTLSDFAASDLMFTVESVLATSHLDRYGLMPYSPI